MPYSPFLLDFSKSSEEDMIRDLEVYFCNRRKDKLSSKPLPSFSQLSSWRKWNSYQKNAYAEALLWSKVLKDKMPEDIPQEFMEYSPFGNQTPPLKELLSCDCAISHYPTVSGDVEQKSAADVNPATNGKSFVWRLYLFYNPKKDFLNDHRNYLTYSEGLPKNTGVFLMSRFQPPSGKIDGKSWQLAYFLTDHLLRESSQDRKYQEEILQYLITGAVRDNRVLPVRIKGKEPLSKGFNGFLIPEDNKRDIPDQENGKKYLFVSSVEDAWRKVTGVGINRKTIRLPEEIERLHILVGDSPQPVLSVILLLNPKKVFLWTSERTRDVGKQIQEVFKHSRELSIKFGDIQEMDSHDIQKAYTDLDEMIKNGGQKQIISCTGGNRLMGFAALLVAQTRRLPVVYRDLQAAKNTLTGIQFEENQRYSSDLTINRCPIDNKINWDWVYSKERPNGDLASFLFLS